jgi:coenzyme PQQ synthesis protein D (PqqD)
VRGDRVAFTRAGDSAVLLDPSGGEYFSLSEVGARIWELCDGSATVDEIVERIADEYDAPLDTIRADTTRLLDELAAEGLLTYA